MILREMVERFERQAPICTMIRAAMENVLAADRLDALFEATAERQENQTLLFSTVADLMGLVACKIHPTVHAAYQAKQEQVGVTAKAVYDKLQRMETGVSRTVVRETASRMGAIIGKMPGGATPFARGYHVKILDGNHLRRTERRIGELRELNVAPLPGHAIVVLDPQRKLAIDVFPCEDAHTQERTLLPSVLETVQAQDLWIGDRNFCTTNFLVGIDRRLATFVIRQNAGNLRVELMGQRKSAGRSETGRVHEQAARLLAADGSALLTLRRITVVLDQPTRDGEKEIHILTNLPQKKATALVVAELYRKRWTIETAFQEVAENLQGEIETLGYPKAALFAFCMALVAYNVLGVVQAALRAAHGEEVSEQVSFYYLCDEVAGTYRGLLIAVPESYWERTYAGLTPTQMARRLVSLAQGINLSRYRKHRRGPKKPPKKFDKHHRGHASTARILAKAT
jgi:IS4 transposase